MGPRSIATVVVETVGLKPGDVAGLALFNRPYAWIGIERTTEEFTLVKLDEVNGETIRVPMGQNRIWLRADCDFLKNTATFQYSADGKTFSAIGQPHTMAYGLITFQGVRYSLFAYNTQAGAGAGFADFDSIDVKEPAARPIPYGKQIEISLHHGSGRLQFGKNDVFTVVDRKLGRVALKTKDGLVSVAGNQQASLRTGSPGQSETFQWMEAWDGELILMSLATNRFLRIHPDGGKVVADSPGPSPDGKDGVRFQWKER
jgi:hypothetical protein